MVVGMVAWMVGWAVSGAAAVLSSNFSAQLEKMGVIDLAQALLQTIGAMMIAASDISIDIFAHRHPVCIFAFVVSWIIVYQGIHVLSPYLGHALPPTQAYNHVHWVAALPFGFMLFRFQAILSIRNKDLPRFSDLLAFSLSLDLSSIGVINFLIGHPNQEGAEHGQGQMWPRTIYSACYFLSGVLLFGMYCQLRTKHSRSLALSVTLYAYLLEFGFCYLLKLLVAKYAYNAVIAGSEYCFGIVHLTIPMVYFVFQSIIFRYLGRYWLKQRRKNAHAIALDNSIAVHHGNLPAVQEALNTGVDINAYIRQENALDEFTLLILASFNQHEDAVGLLLSQGKVQVNKPSLRQGWTALFAAALQGNSGIVRTLIAAGANVHTKTEDDQTALLIATTSGFTEITQQLMEAGARKCSAWMGVDALEAATALRQESTLRALKAYESHFQGYIREVQGCTCVASWPGIYCKSWYACQAKLCASFLDMCIFLQGPSRRTGERSKDQRRSGLLA
jgi:hypothetical protein